MAHVPKAFNYFEHMRARGTEHAPVNIVEEPNYDTIDFPDVAVTETETTEEEVTLLRAMIAQQVQNGEIKLTE